MGNFKDHDRLQAILREQESEQDPDSDQLSPEDRQRRLLEILHEDDGHGDDSSDEVQSTSGIETRKGALLGDLLDTHLDVMPVSTELTAPSGEEPGRSQATAPAMAHGFSPPSFGEPFVTDVGLLAEFSDHEL